MKFRIIILTCLHLVVADLVSQVPPIQVLDDTTLVESEIIGNPFDVDHIPIRKNQIDQVGQENISGTEQVEKHFPLIVIVGMLSLLATIVTQRRDFLGSVFLATLRQNNLVELWRSQSRGRSTIMRLAHLFGLTALSFFLTLVMWGEEIGYTRWQLFGLVLGGILLYYVLKFGILRILQSLYSVEDSVNHYQSQIVVINILFGVGLFVVSIFMAFGPEIIVIPLKYLGFGVIIIGILLKLSRTLIQIVSRVLQLPIQYFIYLCTLEIAPLLILWRYVTS